MPAAAPAAVRRVILGTAGHIDHGKTTLVECLTGTRTDRLKEEQERGMTIDVGYAEFRLPDGTEVGFLDVPGHERLVRTMVAGATAMDLALLVVAADDGPMPQTREHVEILDLLGVRNAIVVLTKVDLVDAAAAARAEADIRALLAGTTLEGAPLVRVAAPSGQGIDELKALIAQRLPPAHDGGERVFAFRMPVLRGFLAEGRGTVVTGIPVAGELRDGEEVEVLPVGWKSRVRGIQVHHRAAPATGAGQRTALALPDIAAREVHRGLVVVSAGGLAAVSRLAVRLRLARSVDQPLAHGARARLHVGAGQQVVRVHVLAGERVAPGEVTVVELESSEPIVAAPGDPFVLRAENASATLGGGVVVELLRQRLPRRRQGLLATLLERAGRLADPASRVLGQLQGAGERGLDVAELAAFTALRPEAVQALLAQLVAAGQVAAAGSTGRHLLRAAFDEVLARCEAAVQKLHQKDAAQDSLPASAVRTALAALEPRVLEAALEALVARGTLLRTPSGHLRHRTHSSELPAADRERCERIVALLVQAKGQPPDLAEISGQLRDPDPVVVRALRLLESRGRVFRAGEFWFDAAWLEAGKQRLAQFARQHGGFTPSDARTLLDTTRKWIIPLLEALDKAGFSRRVGEKRVVR
ncbi:MAG: selenocysteine-specific translation elongation factor [Planctomycetia bacterium]